MAVSEESRHHLYQRLEEVLGQADATTLMEHLPPVGWADVATKRDLDVLETRMSLGFEKLRTEVHRTLWMSMWTMMGTMVAVGGMIVAAIKL